MSQQKERKATQMLAIVLGESETDRERVIFDKHKGMYNFRSLELYKRIISLILCMTVMKELCVCVCQVCLLSAGCPSS